MLPAKRYYFYTAHVRTRPTEIRGPPVSRPEHSRPASSWIAASYSENRISTSEDSASRTALLDETTALTHGHMDIIDLCDSDEDRLSLSEASRPSGQSKSQSGLKHTKQRPLFSARSSQSLRASLPKQNGYLPSVHSADKAGKRSMLTPDSQPRRKLSLSFSQGNSASRPKHNPNMLVAKSTKPDPRARTIETIVLEDDDDDDFVKQSKFTTKSLVEQLNISSSRDTRPSLGGFRGDAGGHSRKRTLSITTPDNGPLPNKKPRLGDRPGETCVISGKERTSRDGHSIGSAHGLVTPEKRSILSVQRHISNGPIVLSPSPAHMGKQISAQSKSRASIASATQSSTQKNPHDSGLQTSTSAADQDKDTTQAAAPREDNTLLISDGKRPPSRNTNGLFSRLTAQVSRLTGTRRDQAIDVASVRRSAEPQVRDSAEAWRSCVTPPVGPGLDGVLEPYTIYETVSRATPKSPRTESPHRLGISPEDTNKQRGPNEESRAKKKRPPSAPIAPEAAAGAQSSGDDQGYASLSSGHQSDDSGCVPDRCARFGQIEARQDPPSALHVSEPKQRRDLSSKTTFGAAESSCEDHSKIQAPSDGGARATPSEEPPKEGGDTPRTRMRLRADYAMAHFGSAPDRQQVIRMDKLPTIVLPPDGRTTVVGEARHQNESTALESIEPKMEPNTVEETSRPPFIVPMLPASALKDSSLFLSQTLGGRVEKVLGKHLEELREDTEYWIKVSLERARLSRTQPETMRTDGLDVARTSFANLKPLELTPVIKGSNKTNQVWSVQKIAPNGAPQAIKSFTAHCTTLTTNMKAEPRDVPSYSHFVSIKKNILAPNVTTMYRWPYFNDDFDGNAMDLGSHYYLDIDTRERKLLLLLKSQKYEAYAESALQELDCSWSDVLRFLLEPNPAVGRDPDALRALQNRRQYEEDFTRSSERWISVLSKLNTSTPAKLACAAVLCENFQKMAKFSLWHIARRSEAVKLDADNAMATITSDELTCRICLRFNCPYHGEFKENSPEDDGDQDLERSAEAIVATDIVNPQKVNYRSWIATPGTADPQNDESMDDETMPPKTRGKDLKFWQSNFQHKADERSPFYPCRHPGASCDVAKCSCYSNGIPCEKICACSHDCPRKFTGCTCAARSKKVGCFDDERCICFQLGRECDPDLCNTCGVCQVLDPANNYDESILAGRCRNASIQRATPKHTVLGDSGIHGMGLYACEDMVSGDLVGEYKGEIITKEEADRRGAVYEHQKLSYLFSLNATQEIDSTYFGNKVRFINHAHSSRANLYPRIIMVNAVHRIGLYASRKIKSGEELFFDYGPKFPNEQLGGQEMKSAPHVRNVNLVKGFFNVEKTEDKAGIIRAKPDGRSTKTDGKRRRGRLQVESSLDPANLAPSAQARPEMTDPLTSRDPGARLAAYNISESHSDAIDILNVIDDSVEKLEAEGDEDEMYEPEELSGSSVESESESEPSESEVAPSESSDDEDDDAVRRSLKRSGRRGRGSWRARY